MSDSDIEINLNREFFFSIFYDIGLFIPLIVFGNLSVSDDIYRYILAGTIAGIMIGPIILNRIVKKKVFIKDDFNIENIKLDTIQNIDIYNHKFKFKKYKFYELFDSNDPKSIWYKSGLFKKKYDCKNENDYSIYGIKCSSLCELSSLKYELKKIIRTKIIGCIFFLLPILIFISLNIKCLINNNCHNNISDAINVSDNDTSTETNYTDKKFTLSIILIILVIPTIIAFIIYGFKMTRKWLKNKFKNLITKNYTYFLTIASAFYYIPLKLYDINGLFDQSIFNNIKKNLYDFIEEDDPNKKQKSETKQIESDPKIKEKQVFYNYDNVENYINNKIKNNSDIFKDNIYYSNNDISLNDNISKLRIMKVGSIINSYNYHLLDLYHEDSILSKYNILCKAYLIYKLAQCSKKNNNFVDNPWKRNAELYNGSVFYIIVKILILITLFGYLIATSKNTSIFLLISIGLIFVYMILNFLSYANKKINKKVDCTGSPNLNKDSLISRLFGIFL